MTRLLDFIEAADAVSLKQAFDDKAMEKVSSDLECMKVEVAQNYFNKPEVTTEEIVDEAKKIKGNLHSIKARTDFLGVKTDKDGEPHPVYAKKKKKK